jgi:Ribosomal protein L12E/L44/L45/RPP1/RPP2
MFLQLIAEGSSKLASVPSGGAAVAAAAGGAAAGGAAAEAPKEEEKKEEGMLHAFINAVIIDKLTNVQRRRSRTRIWASVSSTKQSTSPRRCITRPNFPRKHSALVARSYIPFYDRCLWEGIRVS